MRKGFNMVDVLKVREREPRQGEQFTEPKVGGLYPLAGTFIAGLVMGAVACAVYFL
jgi:hypothetical protein